MKSIHTDKFNLLRVDTFQSSEGISEKIQMRTSSKGRSLQRLIEETNLIKRKKAKEENRRNRIKLEIEQHQQYYNELDYAAVKIQKNIRKYLARKKYFAMLIEKYEYENYLIELDKHIGEYWEEDQFIKHMAAYRIQRYWKGFRKHPPKILLIQRVLKRQIALSLIHNLREDKKRLENRIISLKKLSKISRKIRKKTLEKYWKNYIEQVNNFTETEELQENNDENLVPENLSETHENSSKNIPIEIKDILVEPTEYMPNVTIGPLQPLEKPKKNILIDANFIKPTISSKLRENKTPDLSLSRPPTMFRPPKSKSKSRKPKTKKILKQRTLNTATISESVKNPPKTLETHKRNLSSELNKITKNPSKYNHVPSKVQEIVQSSRASRNTFVARRYSLEKNSSFLKPGHKLEGWADDETILQPKQESFLPSLGFKQALPDLYQFIESYLPAKKQEVLKAPSSTHLIALPLKNK